MTWSTSQLRASSVAHDGSESELVCFAFVSLITLGFSSLVFFFFSFYPTATTMYCQDLSFNRLPSSYPRVFAREGKCRREAWKF